MQLKLTKASGHAVHHLLTRCWTPKGRTEMRQHAQLMRSLHAGMEWIDAPEAGLRLTALLSGTRQPHELGDDVFFGVWGEQSMSNVPRTCSTFVGTGRSAVQKRMVRNTTGHDARPTGVVMPSPCRCRPCRCSGHGRRSGEHP